MPRGEVEPSAQAPHFLLTLRRRCAMRLAEHSRRPHMRKLITLAFIATGLTLSACNTVHGAANDVESTTDCADGKPGNC
jgi:predicted small secreted protein